MAQDRRGDDWPDLDALTRHIIEAHHRYVREAAPAITAGLEKVAAHHGSRHVELHAVLRTFAELSHELLTHMVKEEHVLFPFIDDLAAARRAGARPPAGPFGTILNPVRVMESDHQLALELADHLRTLTGGYVPPEDACATCRWSYEELSRFDEDLRQHIHLENDVLFPRAIEIENRLA